MSTSRKIWPGRGNTDLVPHHLLFGGADLVLLEAAGLHLDCGGCGGAPTRGRRQPEQTIPVILKGTVPQFFTEMKIFVENLKEIYLKI